MGILADIGRSNIGEQAFKLQTQATNIRQLQEARRQREFENTMTLNKFALEKKTQMQQQQLNELNLSEAKRKANQVIEEEKQLNAPVDITDLINNPDLGPLVKKKFEDSGWITGNIGGRVLSKERYMRYYADSIARDNKLALEYGSLFYNLYTQKMQPYQKIIREQEAGIDEEGNPVKIRKPEELAQIRQKLKTLDLGRQEFLKSMNALDEKIRQTREQEKAKAEFKKPDVPSPKDVIIKKLYEGGRLSEQEQKTIAGATDKVGEEFKVGGTAERIAAKVATGAELTDAEKKAWDMLKGTEKSLATEAITILNRDDTFQIASPEKKAQMIMQTMNDLAQAQGIERQRATKAPIKAHAPEKPPLLSTGDKIDQYKSSITEAISAGKTPQEVKKAIREHAWDKKISTTEAVELSKFVDEELKKGTMPNETPSEGKQPAEGRQSEIDVYKSEVKTHFNQGVEPKKILESIRARVPEKFKKEVEGYLLGLDIEATK